jgi:transposase
MDVDPVAGPLRVLEPRREVMLEPDEVAAMMRLHRLGWGTRRLAQQFGCSRTTVRRYVAAGGWQPFAGARRGRKLDGVEEWLRERFHRHRGNADVVRQDLERERGIKVSLRTVERAVQPYRRELAAEARATLRFETPPGRQLQIDFGEARVPIGGERVRVYLFVATLGHSRRPYVQAFRHERQSAWLDGIEAAFCHFGGVPEEVLLDNARALVTLHDAATREVTFNDRLKAFAGYWRFRPRACAPYRARTKGKDERGVGYVKRNAIAGHAFESWEALEAHLAWWLREIADVRPLRAGRGGGAQADRRAAAIPADPRARAQGAGRLRRRDRHQRLFRALAADRRERAGQRERWPRAHPPRRPAGRRARRGQRPARAHHRPRPSRRHHRLGPADPSRGAGRAAATAAGPLALP